MPYWYFCSIKQAFPGLKYPLSKHYKEAPICSRVVTIKKIQSFSTEGDFTKYSHSVGQKDDPQVRQPCFVPFLGGKGKSQYKRGAKERSHRLWHSWGLSGCFLQSEEQKRKQRLPYRSLSSLVMQVWLLISTYRHC